MNSECFDKCCKYLNRTFYQNKPFLPIRQERVHINSKCHLLTPPLSHELPFPKNNDPKDIEILYKESFYNANNRSLLFILLYIANKQMYRCHLLYKKHNSNFEVSKINCFCIFLDRDKCLGKEVYVLCHIKITPF